VVEALAVILIALMMALRGLTEAVILQKFVQTLMIMIVIVLIIVQIQIAQEKPVQGA
jgi:hypothetical protein